MLLQKYYTDLDKITDALNLTNFNEESPLHEACRRGHSLIVKELIDSVVAVDNEALSQILSAANKEKKTPLHIACQEGHIEIARYILKNYLYLAIETANF